MKTIKKFDGEVLRHEILIKIPKSDVPNENFVLLNGCCCL